MWWLAIAAVAVVVALASSASAADPNNPNDKDDGSMTPKAKLWWKLERIPWLDETQRYFLMLVAYRETGGKWSRTAHNDTPSEVAASQKAFDKPATKAKLEAAGLTRDEVAIGSVGLFQRLGPYFSLDMLKHFGQAMKPTAAFDRDLAIVDAIINASALQGYKAFRARPTVGVLRLGWWGPAEMDDFPENEAKLEKYRKDAKAVGGDDPRWAGLVDRKINPFPENYKQILEHLRSIGEPPG